MKLEYGRMKFNNKEFNIVELENEIIRKSKVMIEKENIIFENKTEGDIEVFADDFYIEQVVGNYMTNAIKHVKEVNGKKEIRIKNEVDVEKNLVKIRRLKKTMANIVFKDSKIQFSIGYSEYKDCCGLTGHEVLQAADLAMYESKAEHVGKEVFISIDTVKKIMKESSLEKEIAKFDLKRKKWCWWIVV